MSTKILYCFETSSGRIELRMTAAQAASVSHSGYCDGDVAALVPQLKDQLDKIDPDLLRAELAEYGAWDEDELSDHDDNLMRIVWIAGGDIQEDFDLGEQS